MLMTGMNKKEMPLVTINLSQSPEEHPEFVCVYESK